MPLTDAQIRAAKAAKKRYEVADGDGLSVVILPSGAKTWRLRYRTPGGPQKTMSLGKYPDIGLSRARAEATKIRGRVFSGEDPAAERAAKRVEIEMLADVVAAYVTERRPAWKASTSRTYISAIGAFTRWAESAKVRRVSDVTPTVLAKYRAHVIAVPRRIKAKGGSRHDVVSTDEPRSPAAINCDLRVIKTMLQVLRKANRLPSITSSDGITDTLELVSLDQPNPYPLRPAQLRKLLAACRVHDADTWTMTREEHRGIVPLGTTPKHEPIGPLVAMLLLSGMRLGEALALRWEDVDLHDEVVRVLASKTNRERAVDLTVSPALARMLTTMRDSSESCQSFVFSHTEATARTARQRLIEEYGAPDFLWSTRNSRVKERSAPTLRSTCGCYLTCAPSIFGAASIYRSAGQLGHSVQVAEKYYLNTLRRIPADATTLEAAMEIEAEINALTQSLSSSSVSIQPQMADDHGGVRRLTRGFAAH